MLCVPHARAPSVTMRVWRNVPRCAWPAQNARFTKKLRLKILEAKTRPFGLHGKKRVPTCEITVKAKVCVYGAGCGKGDRCWQGLAGVAGVGRGDRGWQGMVGVAGVGRGWQG